jgi:hypothetical protein
MAASVDFTHVDVANRALAEVRARPIQSFDDEDERSVAVIGVYYTMIDFLLTTRKWHFNRGWVRLTAASLSSEALQGWTNAHVLPTDRLAPAIKLVRDPRDAQGILSFELTDNGEVLSDEVNLFGWFARRGEPRNWPAYFRALAVTALAARFAIVIRNDEGLTATKMNEAFGSNSMAGQGGLLKQAGDLDHAARPPEEVSAGDAFTANRFQDSHVKGCHFMQF